MDDILKRMLEVEAEAEEVTKAANVECDKIRGDARQDANMYLAEAQKQLAQEMDEYVKSRLAQAREDEKNSLQAGDAEMKDALATFEERISKHQNQVANVLLYPEISAR